MGISIWISAYWFTVIYNYWLENKIYLHVYYYIIVEELQGWKYQYGFLHIDLPWFTIIDLKTKYIYMHIIYIEHYIIVERTSKMCKYIMEKNINMDFFILVYGDLQSFTWKQNIFTCIL